MVDAGDNAGALLSTLRHHELRLAKLNVSGSDSESLCF